MTAALGGGPGARPERQGGLPLAARTSRTTRSAHAPRAGGRPARRRPRRPGRRRRRPSGLQRRHHELRAARRLSSGSAQSPQPASIPAAPSPPRSTAAAQPSERPRRAGRQGGRCSSVLRRLRARPPLPLVNGEPGSPAEPLSYKIVRPSTVTAPLVGPDGVAHPLESGVAHAGGHVRIHRPAFDAGGTWHWDVIATDDLGRSRRSTARSGTTRRCAVRRRGRPLALGWPRGSSSRAQRRCSSRIQTPSGVRRCGTLAPVRAPAPAARSIVWDGRLALGSARPTPAPMLRTSSSRAQSGASELAAPFLLRRVGSPR